MPPRKAKARKELTVDRVDTDSKENDDPQPTTKRTKKSHSASTSPSSSSPASASSLSASSSSSADNSPSVHQLRVELLWSRPKIWRRLLVPSSFNLQQLSGVVSAALEWQGGHTHLWFVEDHDFRLGLPLGMFNDSSPMEGMGTEDEAGLTLQQVAPTVGVQWQWEYDMGDSWRHGLIVEAIGTEASFGKRHYPWCLAGGRCGPPEDSGGIDRYNHLVKCYTKGTRDDTYDDGFEEWAEETLGFPFDPARFSLTEMNQRMRRRW